MPYAGLDITGKVCLVTGGTSGIGRAIALGFAQAGAKVIAGSTNPQKVSAIKAELGAGNDAVTLDVSDAASVRDAVARVVKKYGRLDAVVNAAGVIKKVPSLEMEPSEFERIVRVNLVGNFIVAQAAGRVMKEQPPDHKGLRGCIVNIASLNSFISLSEVLAYACSKSGVMGLTRGLANEWAQYGIRVNAIAPGVFPTDLNRPLIEGTARGAWLKQHTPMARFGDADEIAGAAIYLISDSASYTTGETIVIDGGFLARGV
ncbi:MAG TPA: SDR family oxidoreductase [Tepidisphaeraceae bacterium]|nr:SDR family oxidoreductase [Tepidisphaeraceae bacterium]